MLQDKINELIKILNEEISDRQFKLSDDALCNIILEIGKTQTNVGKKLLNQNPSKANQCFVIEHIPTLREYVGQMIMDQISNDLQLISEFGGPLKNKIKSVLEALEEMRIK